MSGNSKQMSAFNYFGGKFNVAKYLYPYFPDHHHYVDVFCGSLVVTLNKKPSKIDTANDINDNVINFFRVLRNRPDELIPLLYFTPIHHKEYNESWDTTDCDELEKARRFYTRIRQSFMGLGAQRENKGWHLTVKNSRTGVSEVISRWRNGINNILPLVERLRSIQFECKDFRELIPLLDYKNTFFYCDPPYPIESRNTHCVAYVNDFEKKDHYDLSALLHNIKGKAMISGYQCLTMDTLYSDWMMIPLGDFATISKKKKKECIWINYDLDFNQLKLKL